MKRLAALLSVPLRGVVQKKTNPPPPPRFPFGMFKRKTNPPPLPLPPPRLPPLVIVVAYHAILLSRYCVSTIR